MKSKHTVTDFLFSSCRMSRDADDSSEESEEGLLRSLLYKMPDIYPKCKPGKIINKELLTCVDPNKRPQPQPVIRNTKDCPPGEMFVDDLGMCRSTVQIRTPKPSTPTTKRECKKAGFDWISELGICRRPNPGPPRPPQ